MKVLDGCEFFSDIGIDVLIKKSLLTVDKNNTLWMHNLLQEMGRKIVREKYNESGNRCRLCEEKDVYHVLMENSATKMIEGMIIENKRELNKMLNLNADAFSKMEKLRLLKVLCPTNCDELKYLPNELRLLDWMGYPLRILPPSFQPDNLVALLLPYSRIEQLWKGNMPLYKLKVLNLKWSKNLIKTPNFTTAPNLEILILEGCIRILDVHPSVRVLSRLKLLNLRSCTSLRNLPTKIGMESLETLILKDCRNLIGLPSSIGVPKRKDQVRASDVTFTVCNNFISIPVFGAGLYRLQYLGLSNCRELKSLPDLGASIEPFANPSKVSNAVDWIRFSGLHCYRIAENINALTMLKRHLKEVAYSRKSFDFVVPGSEIPKWFSHQTVDSSIKIPLPNNIQNDSGWMGVAFCCIFVNDDASRDEELTCEAVIRHRNSGDAGSDGSVFRGRNPRRVTGVGWIFPKDCNQPVIKDHLYLCYLSSDKLYPLFLEDKCGGSETYNSSISDCSYQELDELQVSTTCNDCHRSVKVKECGIRIVYQNDLYDIDENYLSPDGPLVKWKRNVFENTEAGPQ
ncbi:hypothetical protein V6N13_013945 [Hibiscus sabdariffa]